MGSSQALRLSIRAGAGTLALLGALVAPGPRAEIIGIAPASGVIHLTARSNYISTGDGNSLWIWGLAAGAPSATSPAQYPAPTLILTQNQMVTINLYNRLTDVSGAPLAVNTSLVFPGHTGLTVTDPLWTGMTGLRTREAIPGGQVRYEFIPTEPGTYIYESGTDSQLQQEMGLFGAIVVRPSGGGFTALPGTNNALGYARSPGYAYNHADAAFEREYLFVLSEMDADLHFLVEAGLLDQVDLSAWFPVYWFINGRTAPDTLSPNGASWLATQPYNSVPRALPGERVLLRVVGGGRDLHPFHHHGEHARVIARDGRLLSSGPGAGANLAMDVFTIRSIPGETTDAILDWMPRSLGWDIYGPDSAQCVDNVDNRRGTGPRDGFDDAGTNIWEWCADDGKAAPTLLPGLQETTFGGFWSGSPYLGQSDTIPVGEGGLNPTSGLAFMWHSHTEKEITNFDIFPGGMMTIFIVEPPGVTDIPRSVK
jgi:hypothetical protein